MWFVSTYMALFTMFRLHHKVSLNCVYFIDSNDQTFVFMQPACLEVLWKLAWVGFETLIKYDMVVGDQWLNHFTW